MLKYIFNSFYKDIEERYSVVVARMKDNYEIHVEEMNCRIIELQSENTYLRNLIDNRLSDKLGVQSTPEKKDHKPLTHGISIDRLMHKIQNGAHKEKQVDDKVKNYWSGRIKELEHVALSKDSVMDQETYVPD